MQKLNSLTWLIDSGRIKLNASSRLIDFVLICSIFDKFDSFWIILIDFELIWWILMISLIGFGLNPFIIIDFGLIWWILMISLIDFASIRLIWIDFRLI